MFLPRRLFAAIPLVAVSVLLLSACSGKPENSPVLRKKFAEMEEMKQEMQDVSKSIRAVAGDITIMRDEISSLRSGVPAGQDGTELVRRLEAIEQRLSGIEQGGGMTVASRTTQPASNTDPIKDVTGSSSAEFAGLAVPKETAAVSAPKPTVPQNTLMRQETSRQTAAPAPAPKPEVKRSTPTGRYYTLQAGDTLDKLANENNITVADLRQANRLPAGAQPLKGQRLFIPAK